MRAMWKFFSNRVRRSKLRIRDFEAVLRRGFLGKDAIRLYEALPVSDQGLTRERYLRLVEKVPQELRQRYFKAVRVLLRQSCQWSVFSCQLIVEIERLRRQEELRTDNCELRTGFLGLEPDRRRPWVQRAVRATKGIQDFYGEGKV